MKVSQCVICESEKVNSKEIHHKILGLCQLNVCKDCGHQSLVRKFKKMNYKILSESYYKDNTMRGIFTKKYKYFSRSPPECL